MADTGDLFEMRRLEALSNTIFGVAMTLLAYGFKGPTLTGTPVWSTIWSTYRSQIIALLISFLVAGMFWISHQRRLAYQPHATRLVLYLNLLFLLFIIALPVTSGLYGNYDTAPDVVVLYSCHLTVLAAFNGMLWLLAGLARGQPSMAAGMAYVITVFVVATCAALAAPQSPIIPWLWCCGYATPFIDGFFDQRRKKHAPRPKPLSVSDL